MAELDTSMYLNDVDVDIEYGGQSASGSIPVIGAMIIGMTNLK